MRKPQVTPLRPRLVSHPKPLDCPLKPSGSNSFHSLKDISVPPLNLPQNCSYSIIFDRGQKLQKYDNSTRRGDDSYIMSHRSEKISQSFLTERRGREQQLLIDLKMLKLENEQLKKEISEYRRESNYTERLKGEINRLSFQNKELLFRLEQGEKSRSNDETTKEINLYREIIEKMEKKMTLLAEQSQSLKDCLQKKTKQLRQAESVIGGFDSLRMRVVELETLVREDAEEWQHFKSEWMGEKDHYLKIIRNLQFQLQKA